MILNNLSLDQIQRATMLGSDYWETCSLRTPVIYFDHIKEVALAISLETVDQKAINMPWLYISTLEANSDIEHHYVLPIRLPEHNVTGRFTVLKHLYSHALNDGLSVDETVELLMRCIVYRRKDLSDNVSRVVKTIKTIHNWGFSHNA